MALFSSLSKQEFNTIEVSLLVGAKYRRIYQLPDPGIKDKEAKLTL